MIKEPAKVKLVLGILASNMDVLNSAHRIISGEFGFIDNQSSVFPFTFTHYYNDEMGENIQRQFVSFEKHISPEELCRIKLRTIQLENSQRDDGKRIMNLDPGYLTLHSLILASTKEACYRVYLGDGIFAQPMLQYKKSAFIPFEFTYPDYSDERTLTFFSNVRKIYSEQIKT